jgi:LacI family transcriptional regulator
MSMQKRPTIRDIATKTGFSKSTVSDALRGDPRVKATTREQIEAVAQAMGYRPHPHFRLLGAQRRRKNSTGDEVIALIVHTDDIWRGPRFDVARERARGLGYVPEIWSIDEKTDCMELAHVLSNRGVRGLLLVKGCVFDPGPDFPWDSFACVALENRTGPASLDRVQLDPFRAVAIAWERLAAAGWRRVGCYLPYDGAELSQFDEQRLAAFEYYQRRYCSPEETIPPLSCRFNEISPFRDWYREYRPDALIGVVASPVTDDRFLEGLGPKPPLVCLQIGDRSARIAGLLIHLDRVQVAAINWLEEKLRFGQYGLSVPARRMLIEPEWHDGETLWPKGE